MRRPKPRTYSAYTYVVSYSCIHKYTFTLHYIYSVLCMYTYTSCTALHRNTVVSLCALLIAAFEFNVSLELQGGDCSDQLTLICRHSDVLTSPNWIHDGTAESGQLLDTAFPGAMYTVQSNTEHRVTITGVGNVQALDGYIIQCVYSIQGNLIKSNVVKYSFIPPGQCMCCIQGMSSRPYVST